MWQEAATLFGSQKKTEKIHTKKLIVSVYILYIYIIYI